MQICKQALLILVVDIIKVILKSTRFKQLKKVSEVMFNTLTE